MSIQGGTGTVVVSGCVSGILGKVVLGVTGERGDIGTGMSYSMTGCLLR